MPKRAYEPLGASVLRGGRALTMAAASSETCAHGVHCQTGGYSVLPHIETIERDPRLVEWTVDGVLVATVARHPHPNPRRRKWSVVSLGPIQHETTIHETRDAARVAANKVVQDYADGLSRAEMEARS